MNIIPSYFRIVTVIGSNRGKSIVLQGFRWKTWNRIGFQLLMSSNIYKSTKDKL